MSHGSHSSPLYHQRPPWQWRALGVATAAAYALGALGFWLYDVDHGQGGHPIEALYHAFQLFVLQPPPLDPPLNLPLEIARWLALAVVGLTAAAAAYRIFAADIDALRLGFQKGHVLICGRGDLVLSLVRSQRAREPHGPIVVIVSAGETELIEACQAFDSIVLVGRPSALLEKAKISKAARLIAVYEEDSANVEIAVRACALSRASRPASKPPLECHAQVSDVDLRESLRRHHLPVQDGRCRVHFFDFFDDAARDVLLTLLPIDHKGVGEAETRQVHLVIVGLGAMGLRVAVKAAQLGHFANRKLLRISIIDRDAGNRERALLYSYPGIRQTCDLTCHEYSMPSADGHKLIEDWCAATDTMTSIAVCLDDDAVALDVAMRLAATVHGKDIPVAVRMSRPDGLTTLVTQDPAPSAIGRRLRAFGWLDEGGIARLLGADTREQMAMLVQVDFVELARTQGRPSELDEAVRKWDELTNEDFKESNRQQVDHMSIKLRAVGLELVAEGDPQPEASFSTEEIELMAEMEHARWVAERVLAGWAHGPERNASKRTNPNLVPWAQLDDDTKQYDRNAVNKIPELVKVVKKKVCRRA